MQRVPRFGVIDNHQRPIPRLNPIAPLTKTPPSATVVSGSSGQTLQATKVSPSTDVDVQSAEMMQAQIKLNADMMKRVEALEAEKKCFADEIKALRTLSERSQKEAAFYKAKYAESSSQYQKLNEKLAKRKVDGNQSSENKENDVAKTASQTSD